MNYPDGKRYYSLDAYYRQIFGEKIYKLSLDGGMTCPNRDGTLGLRGCIFCSAGGSGDFATPRNENVTLQITEAISHLSANRKGIRRFIAYFQSYTNTYAPVSYLEHLFTESIRHPSIAGLSIATRPDCIPPEVLSLLASLSRKKPVFVELGLQTIHESTADYIRRGYPLSVFDDTVIRLSLQKIPVIVHLILGLPKEGEKELLATIRHINELPVSGVKLQLLHVLKGTDLAREFGNFPILSMNEYISLLISCLEHLRPDIVIHRLTGDGPKELLLAPLWSLNKRQVLNQLQHELKAKNTHQGALYKEARI